MEERGVPGSLSTRTEGSGSEVYRKTGPEHFSPLADKRQPEDMLPECSVEGCPDPSLGAQILEFTGSQSVGRWTAIVEFYCKEHSPAPPSVMSRALYPAYRVARKHARGRYSLQRLDRSQMLKRLEG